MPGYELTTPVVLLIFNRPEGTQRVFNEIAKAKPKTLLVVGDGPRPQCQGEDKKVMATRNVIKQVDWPCKVFTNFSEHNLGCKIRISSGLDWVFNQVKEAIVLEDDCLPHPSFFRFCQELLSYYRGDQRVGMISGNNFLSVLPKIRNAPVIEESYYFSKYFHIWGWASWQDRWFGKYDVNMTLWPDIRNQGRVYDLVRDKSDCQYWENIFDRTYQGKINTWDHQWTFTHWLEGRVSIMPKVNLVSNIGFNQDATHTSDTSPLANLSIKEIDFPLVHPKLRVRNSSADLVSKEIFFNPLWKRVWNNLFRITFWRRVITYFINKIWSLGR